MKEKIVQIQFDYSSYVKSITAVWDYSIKKKKIVKNYLFHSLMAVSLMAAGFIFELKDLYPLILIFGFCYIIYMIIKWAKLYKSKKEYFRKALNKAREYQANKEQCIYSFNENTLEYKDEKHTSILSWELFGSYVIFNDTIMLFLKENDNLYTSINKAMVSYEDFNDIHAFLKDKLY